MRRSTASHFLLVLVQRLVSALKRGRVRLRWSHQESVDLAASQLVFAERTFSISHPIRLTVRVDRAYHDGTAMFLMEFKTRYAERVYSSDIIELSAQRLALQFSTGQQVHDFGYIVLQHPVTRQRTTRKVPLLSQADVIGIADRQRLLLGGELAPRHARNTECCRCCEYQLECRTDTPRSLCRIE